MPEMNLPKSYEGYSTDELLRLWQQIQTPEGIPKDVPPEKVRAYQNFLRTYKLGVHQYS